MSLLPGDILAFRRDNCMGRAIQRCSCAFPWTRPEYRVNHVGIVAPESYGGKLVLFESTASLPADWPCVITGKPVKGAQAHNLEKRLRYAAHCGDTVWHWPLKHWH